MKRKSRRKASPEPKGPKTDWPAVKKPLEGLPLVEGEVWEVGLKHFPGWIRGNPPKRPWVGIVISSTRGFVLSHEVFVDPPTPDWVWPAVARAMLAPMERPCMRPSEIRVLQERELGVLSAPLAELGIRSTLCERLDELERVTAAMCRELESEFDQAALTRLPGIRVQNVAFFFATADRFFKHAPWERVRGDAIMRLHCESFSRTPWFGVVMGQSGIVTGLALYEELESLRALVRGLMPDVEAGSSLATLSLMFSCEHEIPIPDLDAAEANRWPISGPAAYPLPMRMIGGVPQRLSPAEVDTLSACLFVVPAFIDLENAKSATFRVDGPMGQWDVQAAWEPA